MPGKSINTAEVLSLLRELAGRILTLTTDLSPTQLQTKPQPEEWSVGEVLAHLHSCADVCGNCIRLILTEDLPTIRAINPTTWINQTDYPNLEFGSSLHFFTQQRADLVSVLEGLPEESWGRGALVTGGGKARVRTVQSFAMRLAVHERTHLKQLEWIISTL